MAVALALGISLNQCGQKKLLSCRIFGGGDGGGGGDNGGGFPSFLPKEVHNINDPFARTLAQRIQRLPVEVGFSDSCIMSSCVKPRRRGEANPVVLLHCFDSSCLEWRSAFPLLENEGVEAWAVDILGWGFSDLEKRPPCNVASKRYHLYEFWKSHIKRPMTLVGPSLGAAVAIDFAVNFPEAVEKLVLINPNVYMYRQGFTKLPKSMAYAMASLLKSIPIRWYAKVLVFDGISLPRILDWTNVGRLHCLMPWWEDATVNFMLSGGYNVSGQIKKQYFQLLSHRVSFSSYDHFVVFFRDVKMRKISAVKPNVLLICSERDKIVNFKFAERLKNELPNATMQMVPNCGHMPHIENPNVIAKLIADFARSSTCDQTTVSCFANIDISSKNQSYV